jgi:hypothetical protein
VPSLTWRLADEEAEKQVMALSEELTSLKLTVAELEKERSQAVLCARRVLLPARASSSRWSARVVGSAQHAAATGCVESTRVNSRVLASPSLESRRAPRTAAYTLGSPLIRTRTYTQQGLLFREAS